MLRALPSYASRLLALLIPLGLAACADTISSSEVTPSSELLKEYDKTLTKSEQKAAISDLEAAAGESPRRSEPRIDRRDRRKIGPDAGLAARGEGPAGLAPRPIFMVQVMSLRGLNGVGPLAS